MGDLHDIKNHRQFGVSKKETLPVKYGFSYQNDLSASRYLFSLWLACLGIFTSNLKPQNSNIKINLDIELSGPSSSTIHVSTDQLDSTLLHVLVQESAFAIDGFALAFQLELQEILRETKDSAALLNELRKITVPVGGMDEVEFVTIHPCDVDSKCFRFEIISKFMDSFGPDELIILTLDINIRFPDVM